MDEESKIKEKSTQNYQISTNNMLFIIPSWGDLLGYPTLGKYANQKVSRIFSDPILFLSGVDYSFTTPTETIHCLFGLGYYYTKFELQSGKYITDNKQLTGLILSDFVYDYMATSKNITLEDDPDVIFCEKCIKIPVDLSFKTSNQIIFIKGVLMRNIFIPYKEIILEFMKNIRIEDAYNINKFGHTLLCASSENFNKIFISDQIFDKKYSDQTAGIDKVVLEVDKYLAEIISPEILMKIQENINDLKELYSNLEYDPIYLFSILENASGMLPLARFNIIQKKKIEESSLAVPKISLFKSAEYRINSFVEWTEQFKRNKREEIEKPRINKDLNFKDTVKRLIQREQLDTKEALSKDISKKRIKVSEIPKKYELDQYKSHKVEKKQLLNPPEGNIIEILLYLRDVVNDDYDMVSIGKAFELARDNLRKLILQSDYMWEMSKYANMYQRRWGRLSLPLKEKKDLTVKINGWINSIKEEERLEKERIERERLEQERLERERLEKARAKKELLEKMEREKAERERLERERLEEEAAEYDRQEKERLEQERLEQERLERIKNVQLEKERIEQEKLFANEKSKLEREQREKQRLEDIRRQKELLEKSKREPEQMKRERKELEKKEKQRKKEEKRLEKERKKEEKRRKKLLKS